MNLFRKSDNGNTTIIFAFSAVALMAATGAALDLNGFTISSTSASATGNGIGLNGVKNVTIYNGFIQSGVTNNGSGVYSGGGFASGIRFSAAFPANIRVSRLTVSGCQNYGIYLGLSGSTANPTMVDSCTVQTSGGNGIYANSVSHSLAFDCANTGIQAGMITDSEGRTTSSINAGISGDTVINCKGYAASTGYGITATSAQNCFGITVSGVGLFCITGVGCIGSSTSPTTGTGISVGTGGTLSDCTGSYCASGIVANNYCTLKNCSTYSCITNGIFAGQSCQILNCTASSIGSGTAGVGITVGSRSTIEGCTANDNRSDGMVAAGDCTVANNHASHNGLGGTGTGIHVSGAGSRIEGNQTRDNATDGIQSDGGAGADTIIRNTSGSNGVLNYSPSSGTSFGPVQTPATMTNPSANQ